MRKILFRGKRLNPERPEVWLYGDLQHGHLENEWLIKPVHMNFEAQVKRDTVGQFTGECDCDGKEIFEGNIVEIFNGWDETGDLAYIEWDDDCGNAIGGFSLKFNIQYGRAWVDCFEEDSDIPGVRIIGNLYDGIADTEKSEKFYKDNNLLKSRITASDQSASS